MSEMRNEVMVRAKEVFEAIFKSNLNEHERQAIIYACIMSEALKESKSRDEFLKNLFSDYAGSKDEKEKDESKKEKSEGDVITEVLSLFSGYSMIDIMAMIGVIIKVIVKNSPISTDEFLNMLMGMPEDKN